MDSDLELIEQSEHSEDMSISENGAGESVPGPKIGSQFPVMDSDAYKSVIGISTMTRVLPTPSNETVGFCSLPDQAMSKSTERGFIFNILCVGETGIGKSTLMDSLFNSSFPFTESTAHTLSEVDLEINSYDLKESNVALKLTVAETKGYGDQIDKVDSIGPILKYVDDQMEAYLQEELKVNRCLALYDDTRVHCCIFLIAPNGYGLKALDIESMKKLDKKINLIPVIAKGDAIAKSELSFFKQKIMDDLKTHEINYYSFPTDDEAIIDANEAMNKSLPFAVVGSTEYVQSGKTEVRGRCYPWGNVEVNKDTHSDFSKLRESIIRTNMLDLLESTHKNHYEIFRQKRLAHLGYDVSFDTSGDSCSLGTIIERKEEENKLRMRYDGWMKNEDTEFDEREAAIAEMKQAVESRYKNQIENLNTEMCKVIGEVEEFQTLILKKSTSRKSFPNLPKSSTLGRFGFNSMRN